MDNRYIGNPINIAKHFKRKIELIHVIDEDLNNGLFVNYDIYDKLTYHIHVQVELKNEQFIYKLKQLNVRTIGFSKGKYDGLYTDKITDDIDYFRDIITSNKKLLNYLSIDKRVFGIDFEDPRLFMVISSFFK